MRFIGFFELRLCLGVVRVPVWMQFLGFFAVAFLDFVGAGPFGNAKHLVIVTFCHGSYPLMERPRPAWYGPAS